MSTFVRPHRPAPAIYRTSQKLEALREFCGKPLSSLGECIAAAISGRVLFLVFALILLAT